MNERHRLQERLNNILPKITGDSFLKSERLGNEIPFYAFDYPPEQESTVREYVEFLEPKLKKKLPDMTVLHVNLLQLALDTLNSRKGNIYDASLKMQTSKGDKFVFKALSAPLEAGKVATVLAERAKEANAGMVLITGVGSVYPLIRTHHLLHALHAKMGQTPLIVFYPGKYTGQGLSLFGLLPDKPYYRAFRLVD
ncbi:DUF1788 domain-containing protein [Pelagibaculum spongiae]|uniref:DUF1788 domain-containing protein n=1 Tax=Pelagibaculum spongiae TaxID=2080658 RepID=A0A2V1GT42_9GAMM|nr:DUF1788 domain-containing protein [Pelagibaculum spongiae]PVZ66777.1 DUF1788 domain-containing protein [Pelagibaculum spongiae]